MRHILTTIANAGYNTQTVCIGGVNGSNLQRILFQSGARAKTLDGVAIVSAIMAAEDPKAASKDLLSLVRNTPAFQLDKWDGSTAADPQSVIAQVPSVIKTVHETTPLSHNMTNLVCGSWTHSSLKSRLLTSRRSCRILPQTSPWP